MVTSEPNSGSVGESPTPVDTVPEPGVGRIHHGPPVWPPPIRDLPHTLFGSLASNAAPIRYNLRIVTDIAIVGPRTLVTAVAYPYGTPRAVGTVGVPVHATKRAYVTTPMIKGG